MDSSPTLLTFLFLVCMRFGDTARYGKYNEAGIVAFAVVAHCLDTETKKGIE
jgi:hypothetical protein